MQKQLQNHDTIAGLRSLILLLAALGLFYGVVVLVASRPQYKHDELRYVEHADRIAQGKWTNTDQGRIRNGPLLPLVLVGLKHAGQPYSTARVVNVVLLLLSLGILFRTFLSMGVSQKWSFCAVGALGLYSPVVKDVTFIHTEVISFFLICGFSYYFLAACRTVKWKGNALVAAIWLATLCMNRVIFGWAMLAGIIGILIFLLSSASRAKANRALAILAIALIFCLPYLTFTYSVTGKVFCWATNGGELLYWITSPYEGEFGNWHSITKSLDNPDIERLHGDTFRTAMVMTAAEQDQYYRGIAMQNLRDHPSVYVRHWVFNISRLLYNNPRSYVGQDPKFLLYLFPHTLILFLLLGSLPIAWKFRATIPLEMYWLLGFALIYLGGISLLPASPRSFTIIVPVLVIWIVYLLSRHLRISLVAAVEPGGRCL